MALRLLPLRAPRATLLRGVNARRCFTAAPSPDAMALRLLAQRAPSATLLRVNARRCFATEVADGGEALHARALEALDWGAPKEAVLHLFEQAAAEDHAEARFFLGLGKAGLLDHEEEREEQHIDLPGAVAHYRAAAAGGCAPAMFNLALALKDGAGVDADVAEAKHWYERAAAEGDPRGAFSLGLFADPLHPEATLGDAKDGDAAVAWYREAFDAGHHKAGVNLGILHWHPESVALAKMPEAERRRVAVELWTKAAEADVSEARDCLRQAQDVWKA